MTTSTKMRASKSHAAAMARVADLEEQERLDRANLDKATTHLRDLQARNQSGDRAVTGPDITTAKGEVEASEGLAAYAARMLAEARADAAATLAEHTAHEVRASLTVHDLAKTAQEATEAIEAALAGINEALVKRDAESDAAGQALADAGVPAGRWQNGIRYVHVRNAPTFGAVLPGQFNVEVQTSEGGTEWLSSTHDTRDTRRTLTRIVGEVLSSAQAPLPLVKKRQPGIV